MASRSPIKNAVFSGSHGHIYTLDQGAELRKNKINVYHMASQEQRKGGGQTVQTMHSMDPESDNDEGLSINRILSQQQHNEKNKFNQSKMKKTSMGISGPSSVASM